MGIRILKGGMMTTVQDLGRYGYQSQGFSVACQVQRALSLPENRPALDVNAACSGFIYGTAVARGLMATLGGRYALVVGCEALSRLMDQTDRSTCVLFGDGAGAAIFELCDAPFAITLGARGDEAIHAGGPCRTGSAPISMDGHAVFRFAVDALPRCLHICFRCRLFGCLFFCSCSITFIYNIF